MDQEKNLNEEILETAEEAVETVEEVVEEAAEVVEEVAETVEEVEEKVRPVVYDDFSEEEAPAPEKKEKKGVGFGGLAVSTIVSSAISVVVTLVILFFINAVPQWVFSAQIQGVWEFQGIYSVIDGKDFTIILPNTQTGTSEYAEFVYEVEENGVIKVSDKDDSTGGMMAQSLFGTNKVEIEKGKDTITFLGMEWNKVDKETAASVKADVEANRKPVADNEATTDLTQPEE